jgi:Fe-S-cluster containining protein
MQFFKEKKVLTGRLLEHPAEGAGRCEACDASCCRGFPSVELTADEYARLERLGAKRLEFTLDGHFYLLIENGCEFLDGSRCGIYQQRPAICRRFVCIDPEQSE